LIADGPLILGLGDAIFEELAPGRELTDQMLAKECAVVGSLGTEVTKQAAFCETYRPEGFDPIIEIGFQPGHRGDIWIAEEGAQLAFVAIEISVDHLRPEGFFAGEVVVEGALGDTCALYDALNPGRGVSLLVNHPQADLDEVRTGVEFWLRATSGSRLTFHFKAP
jgi:hypothetical protein